MLFYVHGKNRSNQWLKKGILPEFHTVLRRAKESDKYFAYVLECEDGSLYKGFAKNLFTRIDQHLAGQGAKWTKEHRPVSLIYFEEFDTEKEAVEREKYFKSGTGREWLNQVREEQNKKYEPAPQLLERILKERRQKWEKQQLEQFKAKGKAPKDYKWKGKYKELNPIFSEELKNLPDLPEGWLYTRLGNLIDDPKYGTSKKCSYDVDGKGVLRIPNIGNGEVEPENMKYALFNDAENAAYELNKGDILTIRSNGSPSLVGKCALIRECDIKYLYAGYLIRLRPNQNIASGLYLVNSLNSIYLRQQIEFKAKSTSGVNNINSGELQSLIVSICNIEEQFKINTLVEENLMAMQRLDDVLELELIKAEKNKQSILASAFSGMLN